MICNGILFPYITEQACNRVGIVRYIMNIESRLE